MRFLRTASLLVALALAAPASAAVTYYVSPRGDDANDGSDTLSTKAFKTLTYASGRVSPGTTIVLMGGTHIGKINPDSAGNGMASDSAVVFRAYTMSGNPTLTGVGSWADADSANPSFNVPGGATVGRSYAMLRGIYFSDTVVQFTHTSSSVRSYRDSITWCTMRRISGPESDELIVFRNRIRHAQAAQDPVDTTGINNQMIDFNAQDDDIRGNGLVVRRNRISVGSMGAYMNDPGSDCTGSNKRCETRPMTFRKFMSVVFDSNQVDGDYYKKSTIAYDPYETMMLDIQEVPNFTSKDNKFTGTCRNRNRNKTAGRNFWVLGWTRDSCGIVSRSVWPYTPSLRGVSFKRDSFYVCVNNDSTDGMFYMPGGNGRTGNLSADSCVFMGNCIDTAVRDDRGTLTVQAGEVNGLSITSCVLRNETGPAFALINPSNSGFVFENNTLWGRPAIRFDTFWGAPFITPAPSSVRRNIFYNPNSTNTIGVLRSMRMEKWDDSGTIGGVPFSAVLPSIGDNLYYGANSYQAATWGTVNEDASPYNSCIGTPDCATLGACTAGGTTGQCWYHTGAAIPRAYDLNSEHADPQFFTTISSSDSGWGGDIKYTSPAATRGWGAKSGYLPLPAWIASSGSSRGSSVLEAWERVPRPGPIDALSDSISGTTYIWVTWTHPGQDSFRVALTDTNNYRVFIAATDPTAYGWLDNENDLGELTDELWPYQNDDWITQRDSSTVQTVWKRANRNVTITAPGTRARLQAQYYWGLGSGTQTATALVANTKYWILILCKNDAGTYGETSVYLCTYTATSGTGQFDCP